MGCACSAMCSHVVMAHLLSMGLISSALESSEVGIKSRVIHFYMGIIFVSQYCNVTLICGDIELVCGVSFVSELLLILC